MQVILLERIAKLGQMGDVVDVKPGYARRYLLPQGKALTASAENIASFEAQKAQLEARNLETKAEAESLAEKLDGQQFIVIRSASDSGALYGSVSTRDAADAATEAGFTVDRKQVALSAPIKDLGLHDVHVILLPEVEAKIILNVARSPVEAELQASGKSIQELAAEEEAAAEFEIAELFDDIGEAAVDEDFQEDSTIVGEAKVATAKEVQVVQRSRTSIRGRKSLYDFVRGLTDAQKAQVSVASDHLRRELREISQREARINGLLGLNQG